MKSCQTNIMLSLVLSLSLLSGCAMVGPDFEKPESQLPSEWGKSTDSLKEKSEETPVTWWTLFNDPVLDELIQSAYKQNLSLRVAGLRILEARARLGLVEGNLYPQSQQANGDILTIGTTAPSEDRYFNSASVGFDVAWEMDFWGKFRRSIESADSSLLAEVASYDDVLISLFAEVARTYINIRTLEERIQITKKNTELQRKALQLVQYQFDAGTVTELDLLQANTLLSTTISAIPNLQNQLQKNRNALAILLGLLPSDTIPILSESGTGKIPTISQQVAVGVPAEVLRRRPDIRKAEFQAAAQSAQIGVALSELYPSFTLFGSLGWSANDVGANSLGDIFSSNSFSYSFGPAFKWNLFNYGRLRNQVRIQDARFEQLITIYQDTVLSAAREVEDSMNATAYSQKEAEYVLQSVASSKKSMELSLLQYEEGFADYQRVLDSTRSVTQKQDQYAQLLGRIATEFVGLYKALGGGWEIRLQNDFVPREIKEKMQERTNWGDMLESKPGDKKEIL
jgi:NodT family efflux transporter outer membrane factor (OMF) lipoprotein